MKIAITSQKPTVESAIDPRFGRAKYYVVYNTQTEGVEFIDNTASAQIAHGAGPKSAQIIADAGIGILITGNGPGGSANQALRAANVKVYTCSAELTVKDAFKAYKQNELTEF